MNAFSLSQEAWRKTGTNGMFVVALHPCTKISKLTNLQREKGLGVHSAGGFNPEELSPLAGLVAWQFIMKGACGGGVGVHIHTKGLL